jgi:acetyl esterase/lipase
MHRLSVAVALVFLWVPNALGQARIERDVTYGMYSGLALLMDVYRPAQSNGLAIVAIQGSAWYAPMRYDAAPLKGHREVVAHAQRFAAAGYTVFAINHRAAPRFRYPAQIEDAQRAVRYIRFHASDYGIDPARIGAWGSSSGGHLAELLGTMDGKGDAADSDPINRLSAKVQAVVALFGASDLPAMYDRPIRSGTLSALMGFAYPEMSYAGLSRPDDFENRQYREASPLTHVTPDDAPMLLFHGDEDVIVPLAQSEVMAKALTHAGVANKFIRVPGGKHGPDFQLPPGDSRLPDHMGEAVRWFDATLKVSR